MPGRTYNDNSYRYGFNGKENDNDFNEGAQDFEARMYDNRLGRFLSMDFQAGRSANVSPYIYCNNKPIIYNDPDGEWKSIRIIRYYKGKDNELHVKKWYDVFKQTVKTDITIVIHDLKVYNHNGQILDIMPDPNATPDEYDPGIRKKISPTNEDNNNMALMLRDYIENSLSGSTFDPKTGAETKVTFCVAEPIEVIEDLREADFNDDVIIALENVGDYFPDCDDVVGLALSNRRCIVQFGDLNMQYIHNGRDKNTQAFEIYGHELEHELIGDSDHKYIEDNNHKKLVNNDVFKHISNFKIKIFTSTTRVGIQKIIKEIRTRIRAIKKAKVKTKSVPSF